MDGKSKSMITNSASKVRFLGLAIVVVATISFLVLCFVILRLAALEQPTAVILTSTGSVSPVYLFDTVVAVNCLCGILILPEGLLLLSKRTRASRRFLPFSFVMVTIPYLLGSLLQETNPVLLIASIPFYPTMIICIALLIIVARSLSGKRPSQNSGGLWAKEQPHKSDL